MQNYQLSSEADTDLDELYLYGILTFGLQQADIYYDAIIQRLQDIAAAPLRHPIIEEITYRRTVYKSHSIYYEIESDTVLIVRILGQQNIESALNQNPY